MGHGDQNEPQYAAAGQRIRRLREAKGLSRRELANQLNVNVTSLVGWEGGKHLPRDGVRLRLSRMLGIDIETLFSTDATESSPAVVAATFDSMMELHDLLLKLTRKTRRTLRALRLAAPYLPPAHVQVEWRNLVANRLQAGTLEVQRLEIFYNLRRLQEVLSNIIRYDGCQYFVKNHCDAITDVVPAIGGYFFDDDEFLLGAYWTGTPPHNHPSLRASGPPFRTFFNGYWNEIWRRGTYLNSRGAHDLSAVQALALKMGLPAEKWDQFVEEAKHFKMGDNAPPLI